jgi:hypothetical protein
MMAYSAAPVLMKIDPADEEWKHKVAADRKPWICVDLDGTIIQEDPKAHAIDGQRPPLGEPFKGVAEVFKRLRQIGRVSIWTARQYFHEKDGDDDDEWTGEIKEHLNSHGIHFDDVYVGRKPPADVFIDDKAVVFEGSWSGIDDQVRRIIEKNKYKEKPVSTLSMEAALENGDNAADSYSDVTGSRGSLDVSRGSKLVGGQTA